MRKRILIAGAAVAVATVVGCGTASASTSLTSLQPNINIRSDTARSVTVSYAAAERVEIYAPCGGKPVFLDSKPVRVSRSSGTRIISGLQPATAYYIRAELGTRWSPAKEFATKGGPVWVVGGCPL